MTTDSQPGDWRGFQDAVAELFNQIPGCVALVNHPVRGTRIGRVSVDVWVEYIPSNPGGRTGLFHSAAGDLFSSKMVVECKYWNRRIPLEKLLSLKAIVEDIGAAKGILISNKGVQRGGADYLNHPGNVVAMTFAEFQAKFAKRRANRWFSGPIAPRDMPVTSCTRCKQRIKVPFLPVPGKYCYCRACYSKLRLSPAETVGFELLGDNIGRDVESALKTALAGGAVFPDADPLSIFRRALNASIRSIESHARGRLLREFLLRGPYERDGAIPAELREQRLSDDATTEAIAFIYSHMVNCFKGALTEMLASAPCITLLRQLQRDGDLPGDARLYFGDTVSASRLSGEGTAKGADAHILLGNRDQGSAPSVTLLAVAEVKSFLRSRESLREQLDKHILRAQKGLVVNGVVYSHEKISPGYGKGLRVIRITVLPERWKLPRTFRFEPTKNGRLLHVDDACELAQSTDQIRMIGEGEWRITLRWSKEALAAAAYAMTFWYMEKVGEDIYSQSMPKEWSKMTPAEAGRNAAKMMLYYAIPRCRTGRENQRAIALYNSYGFGYSLGMNFRNPEGRREMLWPHDLDEILDSGRTKHGCRIAG